MAIDAVYGEYFQKSRIFLYPLLGIKRGVCATPIQTYISWTGGVGVGDMKLVCLYHLRNDQEYRSFEQNILLRHKCFDDFRELDDGKAIYVFDLGRMEKDWRCFLEGNYSKLSQESKRMIGDHFGRDTANHAYIESYLYPHKYFGLYARLLYSSENVDRGEMILREVGELCDKPDLSQEKLDMGEKDLGISSGSSDSQLKKPIQ